MKIKDLQANSNATLENVSVVSKGEVKEFEKWGKVGKLCNIKVKDDTGEVQFTLWNEDIETVNEGDKLNLKDCWVKEWNGQLQLSTGKKGTIEKV